MKNKRKTTPQGTYLKSLGKMFKELTPEEAREYRSIAHRHKYERRNKDLLQPSEAIEDVIDPQAPPLVGGYFRYPEGITDAERRKLYIQRKRKCVHYRLLTWFRDARRRTGHTKDDSFEELVGLPSTVELKEYIESLFTEGMCWSNWGIGKGRTKWHIDHVVAIKDGGSHHYTNLRPLWLVDNLRAYDH